MSGLPERGGIKRGRADVLWSKAVRHTYGDVCHICGHPGAKQADHLIAVTEAPELQHVVSNGRPAHGAPGNRCTVCQQNCNQLRGMGSIERARRIITARTGLKMPADQNVTDPKDSGREWLPWSSVGRQKTVARHRQARQTSPGPVTMALRVAGGSGNSRIWLALRGWPALFPLALIVPITRHAVHVADYAGNLLGFDATLCLVACLTVTPLLTVMKTRAAALRFWYGNWMFTLGFAGLALALMAGSQSAAVAAGGSSVNWTGTVLVVLLAPMAATSNTVCQRWLGPEWKRWQRYLMWGVWALVAIHLLTLRSWVPLAGLAACSLPLLAFRHARVRKSVKNWRSGGYSTGGWWLALGVLATCYSAGAVILLAETGMSCARAITGH